jgi:hypothetical protein
MRDQFMRIAMARLRSTYPFKPQRRAVAAKMWVEYLERNLVTKSTTNLSPCSAHARWQDEEEKLNARMDIIGQNGNTGEHYE